MQRAIEREKGKSVFERMAMSAIASIGGVFDFKRYKEPREIEVDCKNFDLIKFVKDVQRYAPLGGTKTKKKYTHAERAREFEKQNKKDSTNGNI